MVVPKALRGRVAEASAGRADVETRVASMCYSV